MHYAKPQMADYSGLAVTVRQKKPKYTAGMFLMLRSQLEIPPNTPAVHGDINCQANLRYLHPVVSLPPPSPRSPMHVFAYRTHAHSLGSVISGYRWRTSLSSTSMTCPCPGTRLETGTRWSSGR